MNPILESHISYIYVYLESIGIPFWIPYWIHRGFSWWIVNWDWLAWSLPLIPGDSPKKRSCKLCRLAPDWNPCLLTFLCCQYSADSRKKWGTPKNDKRRRYIDIGSLLTLPNLFFYETQPLKNQKQGTHNWACSQSQRRRLQAPFSVSGFGLVGSQSTATEVSSRQTLASLRVNSLPHGSLVSPERDQGYRMLAVIYSHLHISPTW